MPWHDICLRILGESVIDISRHFISYWSFVINEQGKGKSKESKVLVKTEKRESFIKALTIFRKKNNNSTI